MSLGFEIEPAETGLLVIDMQNGFCHDQGAMAKSGANIEGPKGIIPGVKDLTRICRAANVHVMWSQQKHFPDDVTRRKHRIPTHMDKTKSTPCLAGTWDAEIVDELKAEIHPEDDVFEKHRSSCLFDTTLPTKLRMRGINMLIIAGVASDYCVENTVRHAYHMDYDIIVVKDCIGSRSKEVDKEFLSDVERRYGAVATTKDLAEEFNRIKHKMG